MTHHVCCGRYGLWLRWIFCVAGMVFGCGHYHLAVAVMVCGRYGHTPIPQWCCCLCGVYYGLWLASVSCDVLGDVDFQLVHKWDSSCNLMQYLELASYLHDNKHITIYDLLYLPSLLIEDRTCKIWDLLEVKRDNITRVLLSRWCDIYVLRVIDIYTWTSVSKCTDSCVCSVNIRLISLSYNTACVEYLTLKFCLCAAKKIITLWL